MVDSMITDQILKDQFQNLVDTTLEQKKLIEKKQDFYQGDNINLKKKFKPYTTTRIKSRNFLSNISYETLSDQDVIDRNFVFDIYVLMVKNLNLFSLEKKLTNQPKHEMLYMLWKDCMPNDFYKFICKKENFSYLNSKNVLHPKVSNIV